MPNFTESDIILVQERDTLIYIPPTGLLLAGISLKHVESCCYLGILVTSRLNWSDHIEQICTKARKLVGIMYKLFYNWADSNTLCIYRICIRPHLVYAYQLSDTFSNKGMQSLKAVQKCACKVCLKRRYLHYDSMLQLLKLYLLLVRRKYLKLTTMYIQYC